MQVGRAFVVLLVAGACGAEQGDKKEPMGLLPSAVTTAEPSWVPFGIRAGRSVEGDAREKRLAELRQLTFDGESGAPSWHPDGRHIVYQNGRSGEACSEIHRIDLASGKTARLSPDAGWSGAGAYTVEGRLIFAHAPATTPCPSFGGGLRWALPEADILEAPLGYAAEPKRLASGPGYDGDPSVASGGRMLFVSTRDGDAELYITRHADDKPRRITQSPGFDGRPQLSPDGARLVWQAERGEGDGARAPAEKGSAAPRLLEVWIAGSEGQNARALSRHSAFSITPSFLPDSRRVLYASDFDDTRRKAPPRPGDDLYEDAPAATAHDFEVYLVDPDGPATATGQPRLERITFHSGFDGEAVVSPDGHYIVFSSSRFASRHGGTNVFVARWLDDD